MSNTEQEATNRTGAPPALETETSSFRLRPERPHVTRLSRKALIGGTALVLILLTAAVFLALQTREKRAPAPDELYSTDHQCGGQACELAKGLRFNSPGRATTRAAFAR